MTAEPTYDVLIIGAGVVGSAIARELSLHPLRIALVDAADDVGARTSKANTAILHTGFDASPGSLESRLVARGYELMGAYAEQTGIAVERTGALLVAWTAEELDALEGLQAKAVSNGYTATTRIGADELYQREPHLGAGALGALEVPDEALICPWTPPLAFATEAVAGGVELMLQTTITGIESSTEHMVTTEDGRSLRAHWLVNAAGLYSDEIDRMLGHNRFTVTPRRGELIVYDKLARGLVNHILLPVPSSRGKGVLVAPTVYGNVLLGPTAEDLEDKSDTDSSEAGLSSLLDKGSRIVPGLAAEEVTAVYAGLRAATEHSDYQISCDAEGRYVCVGGIRSTGLTGSMAIAEHVASLMTEAGLTLGPRRESTPPRMPSLGEAGDRPYRSAELIAADEAYGRIVCHCERVTAGEIRDALDSPIPPCSLDGLRRRTRALNGRCQGFYCGAEVRGLFEAVGTSGEATP